MLSLVMFRWIKYYNSPQGVPLLGVIIRDGALAFISVFGKGRRFPRMSPLTNTRYDSARVDYRNLSGFWETTIPLSSNVCAAKFCPVSLLTVRYSWLVAIIACTVSHIETIYEIF